LQLKCQCAILTADSVHLATEVDHLVLTKNPFIFLFTFQTFNGHVLCNFKKNGLITLLVVWWLPDTGIKR